MMNRALRVPHPILTFHGGGIALSCSQDAQILSDHPHGLFAGDTRILSTYRLGLSGHGWHMLGRTRPDHKSAEWDFQNTDIREPGLDLASGKCFFSLKREVDALLRDTIVLSSYADRRVRVRFTLQLDADFADIFEVKSGSITPRLGIRRIPHESGVALSYSHGDFQRSIDIRFMTKHSFPSHAGSMTTFEIELEPSESWSCVLEARPGIDGELFRPEPPGRAKAEASFRPQGLSLEEAPALLSIPFERGRRDLEALAAASPPGRDGGQSPAAAAPPYVVAGIPWFMTLFGRDPLIAGLMSAVAGSWTAEGALAGLAPLQARERDDWRDAEPGKILHELRRGELAHRHLIPHSPYYGTHDAPALFCLTLWNAWRWTGNDALLEEYLPAAIRALRWCEELGDRDGDGLLEYETRSSAGYDNQGWKDSRDAIVHADGNLASTPLALVELQGYLFAAFLAVAELQDHRGERSEALRLRRAAARLRAIVEERFWMDEHGFYALGLDGEKKTIMSIASNPGHLLWCGLPSPGRAELVARRMLEPDMFTGWGVRTLRSGHPAYNPLSYQCGSVWPHDTLLCAAGMWRYGLREEACRLIRAMLEAALVFEDERLPELFCGFDRSHGLPVPYVQANVPQAWAAAAPILALQLFLGIVPDAPHTRCTVSPWLPEWIDRLVVRGIRVGRGTFDLIVGKENGRTILLERRSTGDVTVVEGEDGGAPLWGAPPPA